MAVIELMMIVNVLQVTVTVAIISGVVVATVVMIETVRRIIVQW